MGKTKELAIEATDVATMEIIKTDYSERDIFISDLVEQIKKKEVKLSYSSISQFKKSPRSFIDYKMGKKEQTDAMLLGSLVHCLVLTPDLFEKQYYLFDDSEKVAEIGGGNPRATTKYKEWKAAQFESMPENLCIISKDNLNQAKVMADAVLNNSVSKSILAKCPEREVKVHFDINGLPFVSFIDAKGEECIIDLKICQDAEPKKFQRTIINDGYYLQGGVYSVALEELKPFYIIAVDRSGGVSVHKLMDSLIEHGMNEFERLTREFNDCVDNNDFHCSFEYRSHSGFYHMDKPAYAF